MQNRNVIVISRRGELRFMLRVAAIHVNIQAAETMPEFIKCIEDLKGDCAVIIDHRDAPSLAIKAVKYLRQYKIPARTLLISTLGDPRREPICDMTFRDGDSRNGLNFCQQLLNDLYILLVRKRGSRDSADPLSACSEWTRKPD